MAANCALSVEGKGAGQLAELFSDPHSELSHDPKEVLSFTRNDNAEMQLMLYFTDNLVLQ